MKKSFPGHFLLFPAYLVLFLYARNIGEAPVLYAGRALIAALLSSVIVFGLFRFLTKDNHKAAALVTLLIVAMFAYEPVHQVVDGLKVAGFELGRRRFVYPGYVLLTLLMLYLTGRARRDMRPVSGFLNIAGAILVSMASLQVVSGSIHLRSYGDTDAQWARVIEKERLLASEYRWTGPGDKRDIYYIILDGHARADILERDYGFDNGAFIRHLRNRGFYVAEKSRSNYPYTILSLTTSLNCEPVPSLVESSGARQYGWRLGQEMMANSKVCRILKDQGYKFAFFASGFTVCNSSSQMDIARNRGLWYLTEFDTTLLDGSLLWALNLPARAGAKRQLDTIAELKKIPDIDDATFALVHLGVPHPPYIFTKDGGRPSRLSLASKDTGRAYLDQLEYTDKLVMEAIDTILARSKEPPIIILQSDHGPNALAWGADDSRQRSPKKKEQWAIDARTAILNAYYLPDKSPKLYDTITPVNSFRIVLNEYFGADYEMLPDDVHWPTVEDNGLLDLQVLLGSMKRVDFAEVP